MAIFNRKSSDDVPRRRQPDTSVRTPAPRDDQQRLFQRNRTLTGTSSDRVNTSARAADLQSPRTHAHHLALQRRKIGTVLLVVVIISTFLFWLLTQFTAKVTIAVSDTTVSSPIENVLYEKAINDYFSVNPLSRLRFVLDVDDLSGFLTGVYPEVAGVDRVDMGSIGDGTFVLAMRHPVAGWNIAGKQYYVDAAGVAYERNYFGSPPVQIVDDSGVALEQGATVASNRFLGFVGRVVALSSSNGYTVTQAILPVGTTRQLEVRLKDVGPLIKLSIDRPAGEQVEDMVRAVTYLSSQGQSPEYVDVRVSGKAFYK